MAVVGGITVTVMCAPLLLPVEGLCAVGAAVPTGLGRRTNRSAGGLSSLGQAVRVETRLAMSCVALKVRPAEAPTKLR